jgi:hypothetical protein
MGLFGGGLRVYVAPMLHHHRNSHLLVSLVLAVVLVVTACGGDDDAADTTNTSPTTTAMPQTTTTAPATTQAATTTTQAATTTTQAATTTTEAPTTTIDTNTLASGSGCTPGPGDLPDGEWFGYVDDADADAVSFDLACWFGGEAAVLAAAEDGEESPPPNDYYVRNANTELRDVPVAEEAPVAWLANVGDPATEATIAYDEWLTVRVERGVDLQPGVWLTVTDGEISEIVEQYVP